MTFPEFTDLELAEYGHIACRLCWLEPEDHELRAAAIEACAATGVDYIEAMAAYIDSTNCSPERARRAMAETYRAAAERLYTESGFQVSS